MHIISHVDDLLPLYGSQGYSTKVISVQFFYSAGSSHEIYDIWAYTNIFYVFNFFFFVIDRLSPFSVAWEAILKGMDSLIPRFWESRMYFLIETNPL